MNCSKWSNLTPLITGDMKKYLYLAGLLVVMQLSARAQGVSVHKDGIYNNNALYAKMDKTGSTNATYSIKAPKGGEVLNARYDEWVHSYIITFTESGQQIAMKNDATFEQRLAKGVVESNMIQGGTYNPRSEGYFMTKYGTGSIPPVDRQDNKPDDDFKPSNQPMVDYKIVDRNRKMPYVASDSYVKQDGKVIGIYKVELVTVEGKPAKNFTFYLPGGTKVASVIVIQELNGQCKVSTMKDGKQCTIGLKNNDNISTAREVAIFLSDKGYL